MDDNPFLPQQASNFAWQIDAITITLTLISLALTLPIVGLIVYFCIKYRRDSAAQRTGWRPGRMLEYGWIGGLLVLMVPVFIWTSLVYLNMWQPPPNTTEVYVIARQWMWKTQHLNGRREINELHVPVNRPVRLIMTSQDVIHSFYVPEFRVKHDVLPGRYSVLWFEPTEVGEYNLFCTEYCGTWHSQMVGRVVVMEPDAYQDWLNEPLAMQPGIDSAAPEMSEATNTPPSMAEAGAQLFVGQGCNSCHQMGGDGIGPSLVGVYGSDVALQRGVTVQADEEYLRRSIVDPNADIVAGYQSVMPAYQGQLSEDEIMQLVAYIASLEP
ncbi:MAG: cytochrome c oxidase subunit II [Oscillochloris sp.]|nr:cytochrome c oxidase subunit II [Oscillochloris sp.]